MTVNLPRLVIEQLEFYWDVHLWPRLEGLSDDEYLWEPVPGAANVRKTADGAWQMDATEPGTPDGVPPVTTIAWRMAHLVDNLGERANYFFDSGVPFEVRDTAAGGLQQLELAYRTWMSTIGALDDAALNRPLGSKGGPYADDPMIALIIHVSRETIHHGAEVCLLRDLYRAGLR
jgi:hypothetical protein